MAFHAYVSSSQTRPGPGQQRRGRRRRRCYPGRRRRRGPAATRAGGAARARGSVPVARGGVPVAAPPPRARDCLVGEATPPLGRRPRRIREVDDSDLMLRASARISARHSDRSGVSAVTVGGCKSRKLALARMNHFCTDPWPDWLTLLLIALRRMVSLLCVLCTWAALRLHPYSAIYGCLPLRGAALDASGGGWSWTSRERCLPL